MGVEKNLTSLGQKKMSVIHNVQQGGGGKNNEVESGFPPFRTQHDV